MKRLYAAIVLCGLWLAASASAHAAQADMTYATQDDGAQLLVMLRAAPPHLHATDGYAGNYSASADESGRERVARQLAREYGLQVKDSWPMPALGLDCFVMRTSDGQSTTLVAKLLERDARVESAEPMQRFHVLAGRDPLYALQPTASQWHLAELHAMTTGRNVTVAELDSGVDTTNPDLTGQVAQTHNFVGDGDYRAELHGTEVAGIIVAQEGNGVGIVGVAPHARLLALRACWQEADGNAAANCDSFTLAKALQFALENHATVVNLSLAGPHDHLLERLLDTAIARHVTVIAAVDPGIADGGFPASLPGVLPIADERSSAAAIPGLLRAPGEDIPTTLPGARWDLVSGSSYAAAEVSGLVALVRELSPDISPQALQHALAARSAVGLATLRPAVIDACAAVAQASGNCTCGCATANASTSVPRR
ncbi:serine protease [Dyella solisilvae]|uniref:Serine protease n=1 Tax=Dyella solisilvae TaxID=1920168 RepID=A0A370K9F5_9GAMM|nr:S8 family serine peptidase [Dyella solisilvae]RDI98670.1 serine protease [Dyella solisilvae]